MYPNVNQAEQFKNVAEPWVLYDSLVICPSDGMKGSEQNTTGFYTTYSTFGQQQKHTFFKSRTEGMVGLEYTNMQSADSMDFAMEVYSIGLAFVAPGVRVQGEISAGDITSIDAGVNHWFDTELPRHCSISLKINQDILCELPAMQCSPGYGMTGGGASFAHNAYQLGVDSNYLPVMNFTCTQGAPYIKNRFQFTKRDEQTGEIVPNPIKIPRTASVEMILELSDTAMAQLQSFNGPYNYISNNSNGSAIVAYPQRSIVQASMAGKRLVQQRAQYHR